MESDFLCRAGIWGSLKVEEAQILRRRHPRTHSKKKTLLRGLWGMAGDCGKNTQAGQLPVAPTHLFTNALAEDRCACFQGEILFTSFSAVLLMPSAC